MVCDLSGHQVYDGAATALYRTVQSFAAADASQRTGLIDVLNNTSSFLSMRSGSDFLAVNKDAVRWAVPLEMSAGPTRSEFSSQEPAHV